MAKSLIPKNVGRLSALIFPDGIVFFGEVSPKVGEVRLKKQDVCGIVRKKMRDHIALGDSPTGAFAKEPWPIRVDTMYRDDTFEKLILGIAVVEYWGKVYCQEGGATGLPPRCTVILKGKDGARITGDLAIVGGHTLEFGDARPTFRGGTLAEYRPCDPVIFDVTLKDVQLVPTE